VLDAETHNILEAANDLETSNLTHQEQPDLVLLDVMMPGRMNGFEICHQLKTNPATAHIRVVLITACGQDEDKQRGAAAGADDYWLKPFDLRSVQARVNEMLSQF
jgi:two-component system cell cycle response regulator